MRYFIVFFFFFSVVFASTFDVEKKIYKTIIFSIFPNKENVKVWTDDDEKRALFKQMERIIILDTHENADFIVVDSYDIGKSDGVIFTSNYRMLKKYKHKAIGGFYWQKGRPNILFLEQNLQKNNIQLPKDLHEYIDSSL